MHQSHENDQLQEILPVERAAQGAGSMRIRRLGWMRKNRRFHLEKINLEHNLHFVLAGRGKAFIDGREFYMEAGDVFMFYPNRHALYYDFPGSRWEYRWAAFEPGPELDAALKAAGFSEEAPGRKLSAKSELWELLPKLHRQLREKSCGELFGIASAWRIMELLCEGKEAPEAPLAERIKGFVDGADKAPSVKEVAERFGVSRATAHRAFTAKAGQPLKSYIMERRFKNACELLAETGFETVQIAAACGFSSPQYFCRAFKARFGSSPGAWRAERTG